MQHCMVSMATHYEILKNGVVPTNTYLLSSSSFYNTQPAIKLIFRQGGPRGRVGKVAVFQRS